MDQHRKVSLILSIRQEHEHDLAKDTGDIIWNEG